MILPHRIPSLLLPCTRLFHSSLPSFLPASRRAFSVSNAARAHHDAFSEALVEQEYKRHQERATRFQLSLRRAQMSILRPYDSRRRQERLEVGFKDLLKELNGGRILKPPISHVPQAVCEVPDSAKALSIPRRKGALPPVISTAFRDVSEAHVKWTWKTRSFQRRQWTKDEIISLKEQGIWRRNIYIHDSKWDHVYEQDILAGGYTDLKDKRHRRKRIKINKLSLRLTKDLLDLDRTAGAQDPIPVQLVNRALEYHFPSFQMCPEKGKGASCIAEHFWKRSLIDCRRYATLKEDRAAKKEEADEEDEWEDQVRGDVGEMSRKTAAAMA